MGYVNKQILGNVNVFLHHKLTACLIIHLTVIDISFTQIPNKPLENAYNLLIYNILHFKSLFFNNLIKWL